VRLVGVAADAGCVGRLRTFLYVRLCLILFLTFIWLPFVYDCVLACRLCWLVLVGCWLLCGLVLVGCWLLPLMTSHVVCVGWCVGVWFVGVGWLLVVQIVLVGVDWLSVVVLVDLPSSVNVTSSLLPLLVLASTLIPASADNGESCSGS